MRWWPPWSPMGAATEKCMMAHRAETVHISRIPMRMLKERKGRGRWRQRRKRWRRWRAKHQQIRSLGWKRARRSPAVRGGRRGMKREDRGGRHIRKKLCWTWWTDYGRRTWWTFNLFRIMSSDFFLNMKKKFMYTWKQVHVKTGRLCWHDIHFYLHGTYHVTMFMNIKSCVDDMIFVNSLTW